MSSLRSHLPPGAKASLRAAWYRWRHAQPRLGRGTYIQPGARLARGTVTGPHCAVMRDAAVLAGTRLGERVVIGAGSRVGPAAIGSHGTLERDVELFNGTLADHVHLQREVSATDVNIGRYTYVGHHAYLNLVTVGSFSSIGPGVLAGLGDHPVELGTTSPAFYSTRCQCGETFATADGFPERRPIVVGNDVWLGARVFIRDGVSIGDGAIVAAGAVVTRDIPPYSIVGGTPAKLIRPRFPATMVARLLAIGWWTWPDERLRAAQPLLASRDIDAFVDWAESTTGTGATEASPLIFQD